MTKKPVNKKKRLLIIIIAVLVFILISNTIATKIIYDMIYKGYDKPVKYSLDLFENVTKICEKVNIPCNKTELNGYYYDNTESEKLIVIAPGLHTGAEDYTSLISSFYSEGYDVLSFDPTGVRGSGGKSCIGYSQETIDLDAVIDWAEEKITYSSLYIFGHSRGATAACSMIEYDHEINAIISVSGFSTAMDATIGLSSKYVGPVANANYPTLWLYQVVLFGSDLVNYDAAKSIMDSDIPVLVIQGLNDNIAKLEKYSMYSKIEEENNISVYTSDNGHTDIIYDETGNINEDTFNIVLDFITNN